MSYDTATPLDVWLRFISDEAAAELGYTPDENDEAEAEANTYRNSDGAYRVEWYLNAVGLVKTATFSTYEAARDWLTAEGFEDYTA